ncbi:MAG: DUF1289 domain-containing protein [Pseudomonadota bacterium]
MGAKVPSPCIDVCKFRRRGIAPGDDLHCIGCSMTKLQKKMFKSLKKDAHRAAFLGMLRAQQAALGKYRAWGPAYLRRCLKKGVKPPFRPSSAA